MIKISKLKIKDYSHSKKEGILYLQKGKRILEIEYRNGLYYIEDSLLHQSDCYVYENESQLITKIEELCMM
jgi:hypothetical protein